MNEFEALKRLRQETCPATYMPDFNKEECLEVIEKALLELKAIKEAKPSEAVECFENMQERIASNISTIEYTTIKQALLKAEKLEKAWEIVKKHKLLNYVLKNKAAKCASMYHLTDEEKNILKEVLE